MAVKLLPPLDKLEDRLVSLERAVANIQDTQLDISTSIISLWEAIAKLDKPST
jgi:hypothetical protein